MRKKKVPQINTSQKMYSNPIIEKKILLNQNKVNTSTNHFFNLNDSFKLINISPNKNNYQYENATKRDFLNKKIFNEIRKKKVKTSKINLQNYTTNKYTYNQSVADFPNMSQLLKNLLRNHEINNNKQKKSENENNEKIKKLKTKKTHTSSLDIDSKLIINSNNNKNEQTLNCSYIRKKIKDKNKNNNISQKLITNQNNNCNTPLNEMYKNFHGNKSQPEISYNINAYKTINASPTNNDSIKTSSLNTIQAQSFVKINSNNNLINSISHIHFRDFSHELKKRQRIFHKSSTQRLLDFKENQDQYNMSRSLTKINNLCASCELRKKNKRNMVFKNLERYERIRNNKSNSKKKSYNVNLKQNNYKKVENVIKKPCYETPNIKKSKPYNLSTTTINKSEYSEKEDFENDKTRSRNKIKPYNICRRRYIKSIEFNPNDLSTNIKNLDNNDNNKTLQIIKSYNKNLDEEEDLNYNNNVNDTSTFITSNRGVDIINEKNIEIDFNIFYVLEDKIKNVLNKINNFKECYDECHNLISYYFSYDLYEKELYIYGKNFDIKKLNAFIKIKILCMFLCFDVSFNKNFHQSGFLMKTIFNLIHTNYLVLVSFLIYKVKNKQINNSRYENNHNYFIIIKKLEEIIKNNLTKTNLTKNDIDEFTVFKTLNHNTKLIQNYYKIIIDNIYTNFTSVNNDNIQIYKFPDCLKLNFAKINDKKKSYIISLFFYDTIKNILKYDFEQLKKFYYLVLDKSIENQFLLKNFQRENKINILPKRSSKYKYSLILDLDETLIFLEKEYCLFNNNYNIKTKKLILRPGLINFLKKMKQIYELILFSFTLPEYTLPILHVIEENEKFFEHILYVQNAKYYKGDYVKSISNIGRDIKECIIIDDIPKMFKDNNDNGICIKPFLGDIKEDKNTLQILGNILNKICYDAEIFGDIRKALYGEKYNIITQISSNLDEYN